MKYVKLYNLVSCLNTYYKATPEGMKFNDIQMNTYQWVRIKVYKQTQTYIFNWFSAKVNHWRQAFSKSISEITGCLCGEKKASAFISHHTLKNNSKLIKYLNIVTG